jgi:regulation of enolase protein 1 (concanavalin A-like superfamily)
VSRPRALFVALLAIATMLAGPHSHIVAHASPPPQNPVQIENAKTGTTDWRITHPGWASGAIEGYASLTSVNRGGQINFYVSTTDPTYTLEVFRIGYYQGLGGRRMTDPVTLTGIKQVMPSPDPTTGLIECAWTNPYTLTIPASADPTDWMSGFYYVKLTGSSGVQQYIQFVVRDDSRPSDILMAEAITTAEAYNVWGGKSLYGTPDDRGNPAVAAWKVSFNRPFYGDETWGAGNFGPQNDFKMYEWGMVQFLESNGYDVTYATNLDVDRDASLLMSHKMFMSAGHDEYWSWTMRDNVEHARDAGINLGFFSANTSYWQVRFEDSTVDASPQRVMVGYKEHCNQDPITPTNLRTCLFRSPQVNRSEDRMLGVMYITQARMPFVVEDASNWAFSNTGLKNGDALTNPDGSFFVGYEVDAVGPNSPANLWRLAHSPATPKNANFSDMTMYRAASGATVFASGSIFFGYAVPQMQQVLKNVLSRLIDNAFPDAAPTRPTPAAPYQTADIGDVGRAGFVSAATTDAFTINGGGQDSFQGSDALYYLYQPLTGDATITARITGVQDYWDNRGGLMIRESLDPTARYVSLVSRPSDSKMNGTSGVNEGAEFRAKTAAGGRPSTITQQDFRMPNWLRLSRTGNQFDAYISTDGSSWTLLGSTTLAMNATVYIGMAAASAQHAVWMTTSFDHVSIVGVGTPAPPPPDPLPAGWSHADIGNVGATGNATYQTSSGTFSVAGAGSDVWGTADALHYAYTSMTGDGAIVARVATITGSQAWVKAGVMIRATADPSSQQGFMLASVSKGLAFQRRVAAGGVSTSTAGGAFTAPRWLKVARAGNTITASQSADGSTWTVVDTDTIAMPAQVLVGLGVSSHTTTSTATATFDHVTITGGGSPPPDTTPPTVSITAPASGATVSATASVTANASDNVGVAGVQFRLDGATLGAELTAAPYTLSWDTTTATNGSHTLTAVARDAAANTATSAAVTVTVNNQTVTPPALPAGWSHADVGAVGPAGNATYDSPSQTFSVTGAGADVWGTADAFHYAYTTLTGNGSIVARVASISAGANWIKAGVMLRGTLDPSSAQGFMLASYAKGLAFQRRVSAGGVSTSTAGGTFTAPRWLKLERSGDTITASQSADGVSWTVVATDTIAMGSQILAGLAVSSHTNTATATATFDHVSIAVASGPPPDTTPPTVSISSPAGGATVSGATTVSANASDNVGVAGVQFKLDGANLGPEIPTAPYTASWDTTRAANGSHTLTAVARDAAGNATTSASVTVTVSNTNTGTQCSSVTISPASFYSGGPASTWKVTVTAPDGSCTWTAAVDQSWVQLNNVAGPGTVTGVGSASFTLSTIDNRTGAFRFGTLTIAGAAYKITQEFY